MTAQVNGKREEIARACDALDQQFRQALKAREEVLAESYRQQIASRLELLGKERKRMAKELEQVPFFKFSRKKLLREELERLDQCIGEYSGPAALQQARMEYARRMEKATGQYRAKLDGYLARRFPCEAMRAQALADFESWYRSSHSRVKDLIYAAVQAKPNMTQQEIAQAHPGIRERSQRRIRCLLEEMVKKGELSVSGEEEPSYCVAGIREPKRPQYPQLELAYEDPEVAAQPIPQPPAVEDIL